jgi:hypothetical protein
MDRLEGLIRRVGDHGAGLRTRTFGRPGRPAARANHTCAGSHHSRTWTDIVLASSTTLFFGPTPHDISRGRPRTATRLIAGSVTVEGRVCLRSSHRPSSASACLKPTCS